MAFQEADEDYARVFATLKEAKLMHLKPFFMENHLQDETLDMMNEEELKNALIKEIQPSLPYGDGFKFSRMWFQKMSTESVGSKDEAVHNQPYQLLAHRNSDNDSAQSPTSKHSSAATSPECAYEFQDTTRRQLTDDFTMWRAPKTEDNGRAALSTQDAKEISDVFSFETPVISSVKGKLIDGQQKTSEPNETRKKHQEESPQDSNEGDKTLSSSREEKSEPKMESFAKEKAMPEVKGRLCSLHTGMKPLHPTSEQPMVERSQLIAEDVCKPSDRMSVGFREYEQLTSPDKNTATLANTDGEKTRMEELEEKETEQEKEKPKNLNSPNNETTDTNAEVTSLFSVNEERRKPAEDDCESSDRMRVGFREYEQLTSPDKNTANLANTDGEKTRMEELGEKEAEQEKEKPKNLNSPNNETTDTNAEVTSLFSEERRKRAIERNEAVGIFTDATDDCDQNLVSPSYQDVSVLNQSSGTVGTTGDNEVKSEIEYIHRIPAETAEEDGGAENRSTSETNNNLSDINNNAERENTSLCAQDDAGKILIMSGNLNDKASSLRFALTPTGEESVTGEIEGIISQEEPNTEIQAKDRQPRDENCPTAQIWPHEQAREEDKPRFSARERQPAEDSSNCTKHGHHSEKAYEAKQGGDKNWHSHNPQQLIRISSEPLQQEELSDGGRKNVTDTGTVNPILTKKTPKEEQDVYGAQASAREPVDVLVTTKLDGDQVKISRCKPRPFGSKGRDTQYTLGCILDEEENRVVEFKSIAGEQENKRPWKMMEKAKKFICGCLNSAESTKGVMYFGIADGDDKHRRGEVLGLDVEDSMDDICKGFQAVLDDHLRSDDGPLQKAGEQQCVRLEFVPVTKDGGQTNLYVVEIEILRNWSVCKDRIYYSKKWEGKPLVEKSEKRIKPRGKGLSQFYNVKDDFDDVAVRTHAASRSIKQIDVQKQVKQPLTAKYKEWKMQSKAGVPNFIAEPQPDDTDIQKLNAVLRERLRNLNSKEFDYILIANKLPPEYRGTPDLSFLQNIPWTAVFDLFDPSSKKDGLHYACNETTDAPRATNITLEDFKVTKSSLASSEEYSFSTRGTTWISRHDTMHDKEWIKSSKDCLYRALSAYKAHSQPGRLICVFLGLGENAIPEMADVIESCFSILGEAASKCISILCESKAVAELLIKESKQALKHDISDCITAGIPWYIFKENVRDMLGPFKFKDRNAKTKLPYVTGTFREVFNKKIYSWNDLEVYFPFPILSSNMKDIEKARDTFYKGGQVEQLNLFHSDDIRRTQEREVCLKVEHALKAVARHTNDVKTVALPYETGSGATTLCRRILWEKKKDYRCAVVKALTSTTDYQIDEFQRIAYDEKSINYALPVLVLVDNVSEIELSRLSDNLKKRQTKCVILSTFPVSKSSKDVGFEVTPLRQLDEKETDLVKNILITITKDEDLRKGVEEVLEREKRFIWFGLELFGRDYLKIEEKLKNHIDSILAQNFIDGSEKVYETVLNSCCLLHYYSDGRTIFPHPILIDYLYGVRGDKYDVCNLMKDEIHDRFGGLLLEDFNETHGYHGWRPAHSLVGEVAKARMDLERTSNLLLEKMGTGHSHTKKYLAQEIVNVFLQRKTLSETIVLQDMSADGNPDRSDEVFGFSGVRMRYSLLMTDVVGSDGGINAALKLFLSLCEKVTEVEDKAYSWQQLARFIGYEFGIANIDKNNESIFKQMHSAMEEVLPADEHLSVPQTGFETAHKAIDVAIAYQPLYSNHYVTKGNLYLLELKDRFKDQVPWIDGKSLTESIKLSKQAFSMHEKAQDNARSELSNYAVIGKIQVIISSLEIMKKLPCFHQDCSSFTRYLNKEAIPKELQELLTEADIEYIQRFRVTAFMLFNQIFREMKLRRTTTRDEKEIKQLDDVGVRVSKLRRTFYQVTGLDRNSLSDSVGHTSLNAGTPAMYQQVVEDILFKKDETPYSSWASMSSTDMSTMYNLLKDLCSNGFGTQDAMFICCKACLRLTEKPPIKELTRVVTEWVRRYPKSGWAHFYNYMLHFPSPNGSLDTNLKVAIDSYKTCVHLVRERTGRDSRKSGAEYFLGKGIGLNAFVSASNLPSRKSEENKTDFWRSQEIFNKLERVCGQKDVNLRGVVNYQSIRIPFDDKRYPKQSKDDLWFYLGFTVAGPYAFDPLDQDDYDEMKTRMQERKPHQERVHHVESSAMYAGFGRGKRRARCEKPRIPGEDKPSAFSSDYPDLFQSSSSNQSTSVSTPQLNWLKRQPRAAQSLNQVSFSNTLQASPSSSSLDNSSSRPLSYAGVVQAGASRETSTKPSKAHSNPSFLKNSTLKSVVGKQGGRKRTFKATHLDWEGKLHHGVNVTGAEKSQECRKHVDERSEVSQTLACTYAHSWRGDTIQWVCTVCTKNKKRSCKKKKEHEDSIWDLGPYYDGKGKIWKKTSGQQS